VERFGIARNPDPRTRGRRSRASSASRPATTRGRVAGDRTPMQVPAHVGVRVVEQHAVPVAGAEVGEHVREPARLVAGISDVHHPGLREVVRVEPRAAPIREEPVGVITVGVAVADARGEVAVVDAGRAAVRHREAEVLVDERLQPGVRSFQRRQQRCVPGVEDNVAVAREVATRPRRSRCRCAARRFQLGRGMRDPRRVKVERTAAMRAKRERSRLRNRRSTGDATPSF
jgi:hypothetical protein